MTIENKDTGYTFRITERNHTAAEREQIQKEQARKLLRAINNNSGKGETA
jgi:hypothetical protein